VVAWEEWGVVGCWLVYVQQCSVTPAVITWCGWSAFLPACGGICELQYLYVPVQEGGVAGLDDLFEMHGSW